MEKNRHVHFIRTGILTGKRNRPTASMSCAALVHQVRSKVRPFNLIPNGMGQTQFYGVVAGAR